MALEYTTYEFEDGVAIITMNRPEVLNSFNRPMAQELIASFKDAAENDQVRAVLLTGAGRGFCAGQDLAEVLPKEGDPAPVLGETVRASYSPVIRAIRYLEKPVICAVNGVAAGAGANIALACDLVFADERASFVQSFCKIGLVPDSGGTFFLPRLVGLPRATAMMMLGDKVRAEEAHAIGMIYKVCTSETLVPQALAQAKMLATQPTAGLGLIKRALNASFTNDLDSQLELEAEMQTLAGQTADYAEGVAAFMEKRQPQYKGK